MASELGFFQKIFASLFGSNDPEAEKKRQLKSIAKQLSKTKFRFYRANSGEVESAFAKYFFEMYKALSPIQTLFQATNPQAIKNVVIDTSLSEKQKAILEEMTDANIETLSHTMPLNELSDKIQRDINSIVAEFDNGNSEKAEDTYNKLIMFKNFCTYDFYFLLKKFDNKLREHNFASTPSFQAINGAYICDDLKNFISVAWALPFDDDWNYVLQLLKQIKGVELLSPSVWKKILARLKLLKNSHALEMMVQLISSNPAYSEEPIVSNEHVVESYITQLENQMKTSLKKIQDRQTHSKVDNILSQLFGSGAVPHLKNYDEQSSQTFEKKSLGAFTYHAPLGYLKTFLLDFTKKDLRELSDILLVRGKWASASLSAEMSNAYNRLLDISTQITEFDDSLADNVDIGLKLKTFLPRADRDKEAANIIRLTLRDVNKEAAVFINAAMADYIIYARNLKMLLEDYMKLPNSQVIINWKELQHYADQDLKLMGVNAYKKIYLFVTLLQSFQVEKTN